MSDEKKSGAVIRTSEFGWGIEINPDGIIMRHAAGDGHTSPWISCTACTTEQKVQVIEHAEQGWEIADA